MQKNMITVVLLVFLICVSSVFASQYQPNWKYQGRLEVVEVDYIIVNDSRYVVDSNIKYFSLSGKDVSRYDFKEGAKVALSLDEETKKVSALWLIDAEVP